MPGLDRTGPEGKGPMTGRGLGDCGVFSKDERDEEKAIQSPQRPLRIRRRLNLNRGRGRRGWGRSN
jgi:hypothetical protein